MIELRLKILIMYEQQVHAPKYAQNKTPRFFDPFYHLGKWMMHDCLSNDILIWNWQFFK